jgi:uncharacterized membrane protein YkoI
MKTRTTILALAAVAVVASLVAAVPLFHSSFAALTPQATKQDSTQNQATVQNNNGGNDKETKDDNGSNNGAADNISPQFASQAKITADQAQNTAVKHMSAQPSDVKSVSLDDENGHLVYSVGITQAGKYSDVKVDAVTGQVASVDQGTDGETADNGGQVNNGANDAETNDDTANSTTAAVDNHSDGENPSQ